MLIFRKLSMSFWRTVGRSCRLRCPRCGGSRLFRGWFTMWPECQHCHLPFVREPGFYLGSIYFNYGLTALVVTIAYFAMYFGTTISQTAGARFAHAVLRFVPALVLSLRTEPVAGHGSIPRSGRRAAERTRETVGQGAAGNAALTRILDAEPPRFGR